MNEPRYNHFWLYVIDLHNHHSIGDVHHAVNPTSPFRMEMILKDALAAVEKKKDDVTSEGTKDCPVVATEEDELADLMSNIDIAKECNVVESFCSCTRKCASKKCPCFSNNRVCNELCHGSNNKCTNY